MEPSSFCPYRYILLGRTFCSVAIRERRYTTAQVVPGACEGCKARATLVEHPCGHMNIGVEVDEYRGTLDVEVFYASCEATVERITEFGNCAEGKCQYWIPVDPAQIERIRDEAKSRHEAERLER
jgi:hypothetical protein